MNLVDGFVELGHSFLEINFFSLIIIDIKNNSIMPFMSIQESVCIKFFSQIIHFHFIVQYLSN